MSDTVDQKLAKSVAGESSKTQRAREKLRKQLEAEQQKITAKALEKKSDEIHRWIARYAHQRVPLKSKAISLFDGNQNTAGLSQRILRLAQNLQVSSKESKEESN
jgi:hypothetical protein